MNEKKPKHITKINNINIPVAVRIIVGVALVIVARQVLLKRPEMSELIQYARLKWDFDHNPIAAVVTTNQPLQCCRCVHA